MSSRRSSGLPSRPIARHFAETQAANQERGFPLGPASPGVVLHSDRSARRRGGGGGGGGRQGQRAVRRLGQPELGEPRVVRPDDAPEDGMVVPEVVRVEDEHEESGGEAPGAAVPERQLPHLPGVGSTERRGGDVQAGQGLPRHGFELRRRLVRDRDLGRLHEGVADEGDVAGLRRAARTRRFPVQEPQTVGARDRPEVETIREAHFRVRRQERADFRKEHFRADLGHERPREPEIRFAAEKRESDGRSRPESVPGEGPGESAEHGGSGERRAGSGAGSRAGAGRFARHYRPAAKVGGAPGGAEARPGRRAGRSLRGPPRRGARAADRVSRRKSGVG